MSAQALAQLLVKLICFEGAVGEWIKQQRSALDLSWADLGGQVGCSEKYIQICLEST